MTGPTDFGGFILALWPDLVTLILALFAVWSWCWAAALLAKAAVRLGRALRARRALRGVRLDGRPHVPVTEAYSLGDLVIAPHIERIAQERARQLRDDTDPDPALGCPCCPGARSNDCTCATPCGDPSCQAIDPAQGCSWCTGSRGCAWPCTCAAACGDPGCLPAVRHG